MQQEKENSCISRLCSLIVLKRPRASRNRLDRCGKSFLEHQSLCVVCQFISLKGKADREESHTSVVDRDVKQSLMSAKRQSDAKFTA